MQLDDELKLRMEIRVLKDENKYLFETLERLLKYVNVPHGATSRSYSSKETTLIKVPRRTLVTAHRLINKDSHE